MSLIIVEGPDGSGKTTLIETLKERWHWAHVHHHGAYQGQEDIAHHYLESCYGGFINKNPVTIMDRSWMAEPIYGAVMRGGENRVPVWQRRMLERAAMGAGAVVIFCTAPEDLCLASWRQRQATEYPQKESQLKAIVGKYQVLFSEEPWTPNTLWYDRGTDDIQSMADITYDCVEWRRNHSPIIGASADRHPTLLIGDSLSDRHDPRFPLPFIDLHPGGCSAWLTAQLEVWGVHERQLAWTNYGDGLMPTDLEVQKYRKIITLGEGADAWANQFEIPHARVPHPQFWKRFHHGDPYPLRELFQ